MRATREATTIYDILRGRERREGGEVLGRETRGEGQERGVGGGEGEWGVGENSLVFIAKDTWNYAYIHGIHKLWASLQGSRHYMMSCCLAIPCPLSFDAVPSLSCDAVPSLAMRYNPGLRCGIQYFSVRVSARIHEVSKHDMSKDTSN